MNQQSNATGQLPMLVDRLVQLGKSVAEDYTTARASHAETSDISGRLLDEIIAQIADALPAICGPEGFVQLIRTPTRTLYLTTDGIFLGAPPAALGDSSIGDLAARFEMGDDSMFEPLDGRTAAERFGLESILRGLVDQLETQTPKRSPSTGRLTGGRAGAVERNERQTAIARAALTLLRKGEP